MSNLQTTSTYKPLSDSYHTQERYKQLTGFIESTFKGQIVRIESLPGDASFRRYHRVYIESPTGEQDPSYIVMDAPPQLESIESFVRIDTLMATSINVPSLYAQDVQNGFLILQDFGQTEFAHLIANANNLNDIATIDKLYLWAIDSIFSLQKIDVDLAKQKFHVADYDVDMLKREMALFSDWFLPYINHDITTNADEMLNWQEFTEKLSQQIIKQPQVVVHRDYHSRNLMLDQYHPESLGVIDFQDAVIGAYTYDLVSLVRDAYVELSEDQIADWIKYFWQNNNQTYPDASITLSKFTAELNLMGVQRHLKILGIFVRLAERDGKTRYLADIPKVWNDLMAEMQWLSNSNNFNNSDDERLSEVQELIKPLYNWLQDTIYPKYKLAFKLPS